MGIWLVEKTFRWKNGRVGNHSGGLVGKYPGGIRAWWENEADPPH